MKKDYSIAQRRYATRLKKHTGWPELIGLVDIFFIFMFCFVFYTNTVRISGISVNIPQTTAPNFADVHKNVISVTATKNNEYTIYFKDKRLDLNKLDKELSDLHSQSGPSASVILRADKNIPYEFLTQIMSKTAAAKVTCFLALMPAREKEATYFDKN
jgi:biopolymer transport protein ExbD